MPHIAKNLMVPAVCFKKLKRSVFAKCLIFQSDSQLRMKDLPFETVSTAAYCFQKTRKEIVIPSYEVLQRVWTDAFEHKPLPKVDFETQCLVGVFYGERPTAGYGVQISAISDEGDRVVVRVRLTRPTAMAQNRASQPYHVVKCPHFTKPAVFKYLS